MGPGVCGKNEFCQNFLGGFSCACLDGFDGVDCSDIDECAREIDLCDENSTCKNSEGSYHCDCDVGYRKNETNSCENIDECAERTHECLENEICVDHSGDYACKCVAGLTADGLDCEAGFQLIRPGPGKLSARLERIFSAKSVWPEQTPLPSFMTGSPRC